MHNPSQLQRGNYLAEDTIAAASTALGGAVAIVRVSGPRALMALERLAGAGVTLALEPWKLARARLSAPGGALLDDALVVRFSAPRSYTGEDMVELHLHGGGYSVQRVLEELAHGGARQALPGEFSFRAVRNGKMALDQAQAVADLIQASNDQALELALEKISGSQNRLMTSLAEGLRHLATLAEAGIDFADQDIEEVRLPALRKKLEPLITELRKLLSSFARGARVQGGIRVAFAGLPNAGKSSFFNALLGEDRSIVSIQAGTTRDLVRESLTLRGPSGTITLRLEDTAGLRETEGEIELEGIARTRRAVSQADLVLWIVDPFAPSLLIRENGQEQGHEQWSALGAPAEKTLGVLTRRDLGSPTAEFRRSIERLGISDWVEVSSVTLEGVDAAIDTLIRLGEKWTHREKGEVLLTRIDQVNAVEAAITHFTRAENASAIDLFAADLRQGLHSLGPLIGDTLPDDILGKIFTDFCIGK